MFAYNNFINKSLKNDFMSNSFKNDNNNLSLIIKLVLNKFLILAYCGDIKYNDYVNDNRWNTTGGNSCCCC